MDVNYLLSWLVGLGAFLAAIRTRDRRERELRSVFHCALLVLFLLFAGVFLLPNRIGYITFLPWLIGIVYQQALLTKLILRFESGELEDVSRILQRIQKLSFSRGWIAVWSKLVTNEQEIRSGRCSEECRDSLMRIAGYPSFAAIYARTRLLYIAGAWKELEEFSRTCLQSDARSRSPYFAEMLLLALAHSGQCNVLGEELPYLLPLLPSDQSRQRVLRVLQHYVPNELLPTLSEIERGEEKAGSDSSRRLPSGVKILLAVLLTGFVAQVVFGSELIASLLAFEPYLILVYEQWWRIATCSLVHAGGLHFASNAIGVVVLGPFLAQYFGSTRFLLFFLCAVVGASLWMLLLMWLSMVEPKPMIGASGGVMGLIGGYLSFYVASYWRTGSLYHREQLKSVLLIIALQTVFDISTPQVSFLAHFGGLISGIFLFPLFSVGISRSVAGGRTRDK